MYSLLQLTLLENIYNKKFTISVKNNSIFLIFSAVVTYVYFMYILCSIKHSANSTSRPSSGDEEST